MGLMPTPMQPGEQPAPMGQQPSEEADANVSPEEQEQYNEVVKQAAGIIYGKGKVMPQILEALKPAKDAAQPEGAQDEQGEQSTAGNPAVQALAATATQVVQKLDTAAHEQGYQITDDVLYHAGVEILEMLAEVAETAGFHSYSEDELQGALYQAIDNYRPIAERMGRTDDATLKQQFGEIVAADEQGKLGEVLPGLNSQQSEGGESY